MGKVRIKHDGSELIVEDVNFEGTIKELKDKIKEEHSAVAIGEMRLVFGGKILKDHQTLAECKVEEDSALTMIAVRAKAIPMVPPISGPGSESPFRHQSRQSAASGSIFASSPSSGMSSGGMSSSGMSSSGMSSSGMSRSTPSGGMPRSGGFAAAGGGGARPGVRAPAASGAAFGEQGLHQLMNDPRGRMMLQQLANNPALLEQIVQSNPELANNPEALALIRSPEFRQMLNNPDILRQGVQSMIRVPRGIYDDAIAVMNGAPLPSNYKDLQGNDGPGPATTTPGTPGNGPAVAGMDTDEEEEEEREFVTRAQINDALRQAIGDQVLPMAVEPSAPAAPAAAAAPPAAAAASAPPPAAAAAAPAAPAAAPAAQRFAAQLETLRGMGFSDEATCIRALEMTGGNIENAINFLFSS